MRQSLVCTRGYTEARRELNGLFGAGIFVWTDSVR